MKVGWIGSGRIGSRMAIRAARAGHAVTAHVRTLDGRDALRAAGIRLSTSSSDVAHDCDILCVNVFDDHQMLEAFAAIVGSMRSTTTVILHTTGTPDAAQRVASMLPLGVTVIDATFSGTADQADRGELVLLAGGDRTALAAAAPVLDCYASEVIHVGPLGAGRAIKLLNNSLFAANFLIAADALRIAAAMGIDPSQVPAGLAACSGGSFALTRFAGRPVDKALDGARRYLDKDVDLMRAIAREAHVGLGLLGNVVAAYGAAGKEEETA